ncbi:DNA-binding protein [Vibrio sp. 1-Bac 57]
MAITREQVFKVADELVEQTVRPTLAKVRSALGGGSYTTISEFMSEWKNQQEASNQPQPIQIPDNVVESATQLASSLWTTATASAEAKLDTERRALKEAQAEIEAEQHEAAEVADQMSVEIEQLQAELAETTNLANESIEALEAKTDELQRLSDINARNETRIEDLMNELKLAQIAAKDAEKKATTAETMMIGQRNEITHLTAELSDLRADITAANSRADHAEGKLEQIQLVKTELSDTVTQLRTELSSSTAEAKTALAINDQLVSDKAELKASIENLRSEQKKEMTTYATEHARLTQELLNLKKGSDKK